jgi:hypothetical protein
MIDHRVHEVTFHSFEPVFVTMLSDVHIDSPRCAFDDLKKVCQERKDLPNHRIIIIGDVADLVLPPDAKRFRPSARRPELSSSDDWLTGVIEYVACRLKELGSPIDLIGRGNHEDAVLKHHGVDVTEEIAKRVGAVAGSYSGMLLYRWIEPKRKVVTFKIAYHHGAWGGVDAKGYQGAWRWFSRFRDWDIAVYGHNHAPRLDPEEVWELRVRQDGYRLMPRKVALVNLGSWVRPYDLGSKWPHYTEIRGYPVRPQSAALLKLRPVRVYAPGNKDYSVVDWSIEV